MKKVLLLIFALSMGGCALLPTELAPSPIQDPAYEMAMSPFIDGKYIINKCWSYSKNLHSRLDAMNVENRIIVYEWYDFKPNDFDVKGRHAFIAFRDHYGNWWGMDNEIRRPLPLRGELSQDLMKYFVAGRFSSHSAVTLIEVFKPKETPHEW